jgi:hypothetical protein
MINFFKEINQSQFKSKTNIKIIKKSYFYLLHIENKWILNNYSSL